MNPPTKQTQLVAGASSKADGVPVSAPAQRMVKMLAQRPCKVGDIVYKEGEVFTCTAEQAKQLLHKYEAPSRRMGWIDGTDKKEAFIQRAILYKDKPKTEDEELFGE